jgi:membrane protein YqaA with SNARE-associated domain
LFNVEVRALVHARAVKHTFAILLHGHRDVRNVIVRCLAGVASEHGQTQDENSSMKYLGLFVLVLVINLLPAFGPPTWALLVFARLNWHLNPVALVALGATASMIGRFALASASKRTKSHFPTKFRRNLQKASELIGKRKKGAVTLFLLFVLSPLPSAQLFVAAGLLDLPLVALTAAFFLGRVVSYSLYVTAATFADKHFGNVLSKVFGSPWTIALQIALLAAVSLIPFIDWGRWSEPSSES